MIYLSFDKILFLHVLLFLSIAAVLSQDSSPPVDIHRFQLLRHSIDNSYTLSNIIDEWDISGSTIPTKDFIVLTPAVANRKGQIWSKTPLQTNSFELQFSFEIKGPQTEGLRTEGFAFWYVQEPFSDVKKSSPNPETWKLLGYKQNFKGLGVFFACFDRDGKFNPSMSAATNDGSKVWDSLKEIPTNAGVYWKLRDAGEILVKISVGPMGVLGTAKAAGSSTWTQMFKLPDQLAAGGYLGFSADTGPVGVPGSSDEQMGDLMMIKNLQVWNLDANQGGEAMGTAGVGIAGAAVQDLLRLHSSYKDQREVADAIRELTKVFMKFLMESIPREQYMSNNLNSLSANVKHLIDGVAHLEHTVAQLFEESHKGGGVGQGVAGGKELHEVTHELKSLKSLFDAQHAHHALVANKLKEVGNKIDTKQNSGAEMRHLDTLHKSLTKQAAMSSYMTMGLIGVVLVFGLYLWKRVKDMEKKHLF